MAQDEIRLLCQIVCFFINRPQLAVRMGDVTGLSGARLVRSGICIRKRHVFRGTLEQTTCGIKRHLPLLLICDDWLLVYCVLCFFSGFMNLSNC